MLILPLLPHMNKSTIDNIFKYSSDDIKYSMYANLLLNSDEDLDYAENNYGLEIIRLIEVKISETTNNFEKTMLQKSFEKLTNKFAIRKIITYSLFFALLSKL